MKLVALAALLIAASLASGQAKAGNAYTQGKVNLRAGPSAEYPLVTSIPPNSFLAVQGCLSDYTWCDVDWEGNRGWVYANNLYFDYQNRPVPILHFGAAFGAGIIAFSLGDYWGRYYVGRPWYSRQSYWMHRPPPPRYPPPRPRPPPPPPRPRPPPAVRPPPPRPPVTRPPPTRPPGTRPPSTKPPPSTRPPPPTTKPSPGPGRPPGGGNGGGRPPPQRPQNKAAPSPA